MTMSLENPMILERQLVSYIRRLVPEYDTMTERQRENVAWSFYAGVTALNRALQALSSTAEPDDADLALSAALVAEIESIKERTRTGGLAPDMAAYPIPR